MVKDQLVHSVHLIIKKYRKYESVRQFERLAQTNAVRKFELIKRNRGVRASFKLSDYALIIEYLTLLKTPEVIRFRNEVKSVIEDDEDQILEATSLI